MLRSIRRHLSYANVVATLCLFFVVGGGTAMAVGYITGEEVVDESLTSIDIRDGTLTGDDVADGYLRGDDLLDGSVEPGDIARNSLSGPQLADNSLTTTDLGPGSVSTSEVADNSLTTSDINEALLSTVPSATNASKLGGEHAVAYLHGYQRVSATSPWGSPVRQFEAARCPAGKVAIGGGGRIETSGTGGEKVASTESEPFDQTLNGVRYTGFSYEAAESSPFSGSWRVVAYAICVNEPF